jgi:uncharacterized membrane protein YgcG
MHRPDPTAGNGMPTFARPPAAPPARPAATSPGLSPGMTALSLAVLSCVAISVFARPNGAQDLPKGSAGAARKPAAVVAKTTSTGPEDRQRIDFYTNNVREGMFSAPVPAPPKPAAVVVVKPPKPVEIKVPPVIINPFADWSYTGTVHMGDITMALLENVRTKEGQYVKSGDSFLGAQVKNIDDQMVTLSSAGKPAMLAKADTIVITPLNQDAPGKNGPPQNGQPQPGQPQPGQVQPYQSVQTGNPQFTVMGPNGTPISGDQAQRYNRRLNRGWGGGGGNGGAGGGGNNGGGGGGRRRGGNGGGG